MVSVSVPFVISTFADEPVDGHCVASTTVNPTNLMSSLSVLSSRLVSMEGVEVYCLDSVVWNQA